MIATSGTEEPRVGAVDSLGRIALGTSLLYMAVCALIAHLRLSGVIMFLRLLLQISVIIVWAWLLQDGMAPGGLAEHTLTEAMTRFGAAFLMISLAIALTAEVSHTGFGRGCSRAFASLVIFYVVIVMVGALYEVPEDFIRWMGGEPVNTASLAAVVLLALAVITLQPDRGLPSLLIQSTLPAQQLRFLLPAIFVLPLAIGLISLELSTTFSDEMQISITALGSAMAGALVVIASTANLYRAERTLFLRENALMAATSGVIITDHTKADDPIIWVNRAFEDITGYHASEVLGRNCRFLNKDVDGTEEIKEELRVAIANEDSMSVVMPNRRANGEIFWNRLNLSPIEGLRTETSHYVGIINDVTVQVEKARELEVALAHEEAARAAAEHSSNARDSFVSFVSHELRAPLNAAQTWLDLMEMDGSPEILEKGLHVVRNSIETQTRLIADLGDIARATAGNIVINTKPFDLTEALTTVVDQMRPEMEQTDLQFNHELPDKPVTIEADEVRVLQVVRNLLVNAKRYNKKGGRIDLSMTERSKEVVISVSDNGKGLRKSELEKVFQPYWRAETKIKGLGIGMALARAIVDAHGGRIKADSAGLGEGASFEVRLPKHSTQAQTAAEIPVAGNTPNQSQ